MRYYVPNQRMIVPEYYAGTAEQWNYDAGAEWHWVSRAVSSSAPMDHVAKLNLPYHQNMEIRGALYWASHWTNTRIFGLQFRGHYTVGYYGVNQASLPLTVLRDSTVLGTYGSYISGTYAFRFAINGTNIKAKVWTTGGSEPDWLLSVSDTAYTENTPLMARLYWNYSSSTGYTYDYKVNVTGVGTEGDTAPASGDTVVVNGYVTRGGTPVSGALVIAVRYEGRDTPLLWRGCDFAIAITDSNGSYTLNLSVAQQAWLISACAIINGVYYASDARLVYLG